MSYQFSKSFTSALFLVLLWGMLLRSADDFEATSPGLTDLDKATDLRITADSMQDLERIMRLCESALKLGLEDGHVRFAKDLMTATLYDRARRFSHPILNRQSEKRHTDQLRSLALRDLDRLLEIDDELTGAHILMARLYLLKRGDREQAAEAVARAMELSKDDPENLSTVYVLRAQLQDDPQKILSELDKALEADPENLDARRLRGEIFLRQKNYQGAIVEFTHILEKNPEDVLVRHRIGEAFAGEGDHQKAIEHLDQALESSPNKALTHLLRARIHAQANKTQEALADLNKAIEIDPRNLMALMTRCQLRGLTKDFDLAISDANRVIELSRQSPEAVLMRAAMYAGAKRYNEAITDVRNVLRQDPDNIDLRLQLANFYVQDRRPSKAMEIFDEILTSDGTQIGAMRGRADVLLNMGEQDQAVAAYETALEHFPRDDSILNNLAWVLATSPLSELRDGQRAVELATKACEVTEYKAAHILSTLAAAHAELGDFETALKWSGQAVELGREDIKPQLQQELESYRQGKAWREKQKIETKPEPIPPSDDDLLPD